MREVDLLSGGARGIAAVSPPGTQVFGWRSERCPGGGSGSRRGGKAGPEESPPQGFAPTHRPRNPPRLRPLRGEVSRCPPPCTPPLAARPPLPPAPAAPRGCLGPGGAGEAPREAPRSPPRAHGGAAPLRAAVARAMPAGSPGARRPRAAPPRGPGSARAAGA